MVWHVYPVSLARKCRYLYHSNIDVIKLSSCVYFQQNFSYYVALYILCRSHVVESLPTDAKGGNRHPLSVESPLLHVSKLRNGSDSCISATLTSDRNATPSPKRRHRYARNLRLEQLALDDRASLVSETSSESSLSLCGELSRVGKSCLGYVGDNNSSATLGNRGRVTQCEPSTNRGSSWFVHPALQDHDYADLKADDCESKTSRISTRRRRYRKRSRKRKHLRSKLRDSFGAYLASRPVSEVPGYTPNDVFAKWNGTPSKTDTVESLSDVLRVNSSTVCCRDDVANSQVLSLESTLCSNPSVRINGRLNGTCSMSNKRDYCHSLSSVQHLADVVANDSCLKENDINLNYVARPPRLKTIQQLRKCEQTDGMPLIQIQGSNLLTRLSCSRIETEPYIRDQCNKGCPLVLHPPSMCFSKTEQKFNACDDDFPSPQSDSQGAGMASDVDRLQSPGHSNSALLYRLDQAQSTKASVSDCRTNPDRKSFVRFIGIQRILPDRETTDGKTSGHDVIRSGESESLLGLIASSLPPSVLQEVQCYTLIGGNSPYIGQYSSSPAGQSGGQSDVGRSVEISPSNGVRSQEDNVTSQEDSVTLREDNVTSQEDSVTSQEDSVMHTSFRQTSIRANSLPSRSLQNFGLDADSMNHRPFCSALDSSDCVWEAVRHKKETVGHGHCPL